MFLVKATKRHIFWAQCIRYSTRQGPAADKLKAIPFTQHIKAAEKTFEDYHGHSFFSLRVSRAGPPNEVFLPFWVVSADVQSEIVQAQVGRSVMRTYYNPHTKTHESRWEVDWAWVPNRHGFQRSYMPQAHPGLQIYASHKYRRGFVNPIRNGQALSQAVQFSPDLLDRPKFRDGDDPNAPTVRSVQAYKIYPATALRFAKEYIQSKEEEYADEFLKQTYGGDQTRLLDVRITLTNVKVSPVYYPAYIYTIRYLGRDLRTFINGCDLSVGGLRVYNWERVALVASIGFGSIMAMSGGIGWGGVNGSFWLGVVLPTLATSLLTLYFPILSLRFRDTIRLREIKSQENDPKQWDDDWISAYDAYEQQRRYKTWKSESSQKSSSSWSRGASKDPKGYYEALGLSTSATTADIQGAFRGLAMKNHPDRFSDPVEKKKANEKFQKISAAYSVLRDPKKRKQYDTTGRA
ncbi:hypothetical protein CLU79DRAFT_362265 [Phycomyces nitens]|nr:hypothetical protein CLU79DRAFT_362265 [Phycomyces nitens]